MGFLNEFAYGFSQTAKPIIEEQGKAQAQADARIREKIASVDPEAELFQRQQDIMAAEKAKEAKASMDLAMSYLHPDAPQPAPTDTAIGSTITAPKPTINMFPTAGQETSQDHLFTPSGSAKDSTVDDHYNEINRFTTLKSIGALASNKNLETYADAQINLHKNELDRSKRIKEENKDALTAADGVNVPDAITKETEKNITAGHKTLYQTGSLTRPMDPDTASEEQRIAKDVHIPLAASYMTANPETKEVSSIVQSKTLGAAQAIATIQSQDPNVPIEEKVAAVKSLYGYMQKTYNHVSASQIAHDTNLQHVMTPELLKNIEAIDTQSKGGSSTSGSWDSTATQQPAKAQPTATPQTATNPQTGEKVQLVNGVWEPVPTVPRPE